MADSDHTISEPARRVIDSTPVIYFSRVFIPVALSIIGYFMVTTLDDLKHGMKDGSDKIWIALDRVSTNANTQAVDLAALKVKVDDVGKSVDRINTVVDSIKKN